MTQALIKVEIGIVYRELCTPKDQEFEDFFPLFKRLSIEQVHVRYTKERSVEVVCIVHWCTNKSL